MRQGVPATFEKLREKNRKREVNIFSFLINLNFNRMKKRLMSTLLMGAFFVASMSVFTSCKDYDSEISGVQTDVTELRSVLTSQQSELNGQIATLKSELEHKAGDMTSLDNQLKELRASLEAAQSADENTKKDLEASIEKLAQEISANAAAQAKLAADIEAANKANENLQKIMDGKVADLEAALREAYGQIEAVGNNLGSAMTRLAVLESGMDDYQNKVNAVVADMAAQQSAIEGYLARIEQLENQMPELANYLTQAQVESKLDELQGKMTEQLAVFQNLVEELISSNNAAQSANYVKSDELKSYVEWLDQRISEAQLDLSTINVLADKTLKSLVFKPELYYWGIEGLNVKYMEFFKYTVPATTVYNTEVALTNALVTAAPTPGTIPAGNGRGYYEGNNIWTADTATTQAAAETNKQKHDVPGNLARYTHTTGYKTLNFVAEYHMNPSSAEVDQDTKIEIISDDKPFVRSAACGISYVSHETTAAGMLNVNLKVNRPDLIENIVRSTAADGGKVTVFATQVTVKKKGATNMDTTITSDYATLRAAKISDIVLVHRDNALAGNEYATGSRNAHCGYCALTNNDNTHTNVNRVWKSHIMQTAREAIQFDPQDEVIWNQTMDLSKTVEVHYMDRTTDANGVHKQFTEAEMTANGFSYEFELTGFYNEDINATNESAHAAIAEDGKTLRPQDPEQLTGKQQAYGAAQTKALLVGRTPLVRVKLKDADGNILDYGYIRIKIVEARTIVPPVYDRYFAYDPEAYSATHNFECNWLAGAYLQSTDWIKTEYDVYNPLGLTREQFEVIYTQPEQNHTFALPQPASAQGITDFQQYYPVFLGKDEAGRPLYKFYACDADHPAVGVFESTNALGTEDGQVTSALQWKLSATAANNAANQIFEAVRNADSLRTDSYRILPSVVNGYQADDWWSAQTVPAKTRNATAKPTGYTAHPNQVWRAVRYVSHSAGYPDYYVLFKMGDITLTNNEPYGDVKWNARKIAEYWYEKNSNVSKSGYDEIHTNTITPEDAPLTPYNTSIADKMDNLFSDVFVNNNLHTAQNLMDTYIGTTKVTTTASSEYRAANLRLHLRFDRTNNGKKFKGASGTTYVLRVAPVRNNTATTAGLYEYYNENDTVLQARRQQDADVNSSYQDIAVIRLKSPAAANLEIDNEEVYWLHGHLPSSADNRSVNCYDDTRTIDDNAGLYPGRSHFYAEDLLNYKAHSDLAANADTDPKADRTDAIRAIIGLSAVKVNPCIKWLKLRNNLFDTRFPRPINVVDKDTIITDASTGELQVIPLRHIVGLSDWRDIWKNGTGYTTADRDYWQYYNIKAITVESGVAGRSIANVVRTNLNQSAQVKALTKLSDKLTQWPVLNTITDQLDLRYNPVTPAAPVRSWSYFGEITYRNLSSTVGEFDLLVPVIVHYEWGWVRGYVTIHVNKTPGTNA